MDRFELSHKSLNIIRKTADTPQDLKSLIGTRLIVVADDAKGYGKKTKYVGQKGKILLWRPWKYGRFLPVIELASGEFLSSSKIWWSGV